MPLVKNGFPLRPGSIRTMVAPSCTFQTPYNEEKNNHNPNDMSIKTMFKFAQSSVKHATEMFIFCGKEETPASWSQWCLFMFLLLKKHISKWESPNELIIVKLERPLPRKILQELTLCCLAGLTLSFFLPENNILVFKLKMKFSLEDKNLRRLGKFRGLCCYGKS